MKYYQLHKSSIKNYDCSGMVCMVYRKSNFQAVNKNMEIKLSLLGSIPNSIFILDDNGKIVQRYTVEAVYPYKTLIVVKTDIDTVQQLDQAIKNNLKLLISFE